VWRCDCWVIGHVTLALGHKVLKENNEKVLAHGVSTVWHRVTKTVSCKETGLALWSFSDQFGIAVVPDSVGR
jgi:hypothetical protein